MQRSNERKEKAMSDQPASEPENFLGYKLDHRPRNGGWAPGNYTNECCDCGEKFVGDKRAVQCADCAYNDHEHQPDPPADDSHLDPFDYWFYTQPYVPTAREEYARAGWDARGRWEAKQRRDSIDDSREAIDLFSEWSKEHSPATHGRWQAFEAGWQAAIEWERGRKWQPLELAILFHDTYERLAPSFGYETREETRKFDPESPNGRLMVAVCEEVLKAQPPEGGEE